jgi:hypothetical protein
MFHVLVNHMHEKNKKAHQLWVPTAAKPAYFHGFNPSDVFFFTLLANLMDFNVQGLPQSWGDPSRHHG